MEIIWRKVPIYKNTVHCGDIEECVVLNTFTVQIMQGTRSTTSCVWVGSHLLGQKRYASIDTAKSDAKRLVSSILRNYADELV